MRIQINIIAFHKTALRHIIDSHHTIKLKSFQGKINHHMVSLDPLSWSFQHKIISW